MLQTEQGMGEYLAGEVSISNSGIRAGTGK
jgi:hypothetical protein